MPAMIDPTLPQLIYRHIAFVLSNRNQGGLTAKKGCGDMEMTHRKNYAIRHCISELFGDMPVLTIYIVILFGLAVFAFVLLLFN